MIKIVFAIALLCFSSLLHARMPAECISLAKMEEPVSSLADTKADKRMYLPYPEINTEQVIQVFRKAVERGELQLFEMSVAFSALKPKRVEYTYKIGVKEPTIKVYSLLSKPMPLPAMPDILIEGVTVILSKDGRILEAIVHVHH
jgi:hypothetical protein